MRKLLPAVAFVFLLAGTWFLFANPFNMGVPKSEHFTAAKFDAVRNGEAIEDVVRRFGKPLSVTKDSGGFCGEGHCDLYAFTGLPAAWVIGHKEAWVVVNHEGRVIHKLWNVEP